MKNLLLALIGLVPMGTGVTHAGDIAKSLHYGDGSTYYYDECGQFVGKSLGYGDGSRYFYNQSGQFVGKTLHYGDGSTYFYPQN